MTFVAVFASIGFFFGINPGGGAFYEATVNTSSSAVFMSGSYDLNDKWKLGFGIRYSEETKDLDWALQGALSGAFMIGSTDAGGMQDSRTDSQTSPTISLNYALNDDTQVYAKYSTGFKSGGYNLDYIIQSDLDAGIEFDVETAISYDFKCQQLANIRIKTCQVHV